MNVTKRSRVNGTAQPAPELGGTKRRRITGKQAPPPWFLTLGLALATVMASKRSASQMDLSGDGEGSAPKPGKLARGDIPSAQDASNPPDSGLNGVTCDDAGGIATTAAHSSVAASTCDPVEDPVIDEENGVAQGHEVTELSDMECDPAPSGVDDAMNTNASQQTLPMHDVLPFTSTPTCVATLHVCALDTLSGCAACGRTCHVNCDSELCTCVPCGFCESLSLVTHENSELCVDAQMDNIGCHACARMGCWSSAYNCHSHCTSAKHVCGPSQPNGCVSCNRICHENNRDVRCAYFQRDAGVLTWNVSAQELRDTQAGTGGSLPHMSQVTWSFEREVTRRGTSTLTVNGQIYYIGRGGPGRAIDNEYNNCLIDSLRQCLGLMTNRVAVREDLIAEFKDAAGRAQVHHRHPQE